MLSNARLPTNVLHRGIGSQRRLHPKPVLLSIFPQLTPPNPSGFELERERIRIPNLNRTTIELRPHPHNNVELTLRQRGFKLFGHQDRQSRALVSERAYRGAIAGNVDEDGKTIMEKGLRFG
ncbi:hypothetical protein Droror1_Dr00017800 [Drosera rotundifolia]